MVAHRQARHPLKQWGQGGSVPHPLGRRCEPLHANSCWCVFSSRTHDDHLLQDEHRTASGASRAVRGVKVHHNALRRHTHTQTQQLSGTRAAATVLKDVSPKKSSRHPPQGVEGEVKGRVEARGDAPSGRDQGCRRSRHIGCRGHKGASRARVASEHGSRAKVRVGPRTWPR